MRALGIDHGDRRVGIAISDESKTLARPLTVIRPAPGTGGDVEAVLALVTTLAGEDASLDLIVVGIPRRLDGTPNERTERVRKFVETLRERTAIEVVTEDERLSSVEADSRLALSHRSWRERKGRLDAASAAIILQDYLDRPK